MADAVLLSASLSNVNACIDLAVEHGLGVEVMAFAYPHILDGDWRASVARYKQMLKPVQGMITLHGPFLDMAAGSPDPRINEIVKARFRHALEIAHELEAKIVVLHANYIASLRTDDYRIGWQKRNIEMWGEIARTAEHLGVIAAIENMWEFHPDLIGDVLKAVDHPYIRACLDVGHTRLYSDVPFESWLNTMAPYLVHTHLNNTDGLLDSHKGLPGGVVDYTHVLPLLRALPKAPSMTLEMDAVPDMAASLPYFDIRK